MGEAGWPALIVLIAIVLMIVGWLSGWDMTPADAAVASAVLVGGGYLTSALVHWTVDAVRVRRQRRR